MSDTRGKIKDFVNYARSLKGDEKGENSYENWIEMRFPNSANNLSSRSCLNAIASPHSHNFTKSRPTDC